MSKYLLSEYVPPSRPYSLRELNDISSNLHNEFKLSNVLAHHDKCNHKYYVKKNGKKEKEIKENNSFGSCSVCWKLKNTDFSVKNIAHNLTNEYTKFINSKNKLTYDYCDMEKMFYGWLYDV